MNGEVIEAYPTDRPYPSCLILYVETEPVHVVAAADPAARICHVITAYRPDLEHFRIGFPDQEEKVTRENFGRCPLCGGENQPGTTTFAVDLKFGVVVVREVPTFVCTKCGDAWIDDPVAAKLENITADARRKRTVVEVTQWQQVAA